MTTKETAAAIRTALKTAGYRRDVVSVRVSGGSVEVTVKSATIKFSRVEEIAGKFEKIDRCYATGEILCGGNTFVFVRADEDMMDKRIAEVRVAAEAAGLNAAGWARFGFGGVVYEVQESMALVADSDGCGNRIGSPYMRDVSEAIRAVASHSLG